MTEAKAADAGGMPAALGDALMEFVSELKGFRTEMEVKMNAQDQRMNMLDRKTALKGRTPLATAVETEAPHQKAFAAYLRRGDEDGLRGLTLEEKAMAVASDGGFLAAPGISDNVQNALRNTASLRAVANVVNVESSSYDVLVERGEISSGWVTEASVAETGTPKAERVSIPLYELSAMPKVTQRLLDDSAFDLEAWLAERIADRFARAEAAAFISGNGVDKPKGILAHPQAANATATEVQVGFVSTGSAGDFDTAKPANALIDLVYALGAGYRANAAFLMNSKTAGAVRKIRDADGRFLWQDSLAAGEPARLLGYPVVVCEDMPDIAPSAKAIAFGDFHAGYTIAERPELRVLRDPFSAKPNVLFYATKRVGGGVTDPRAIKLLNFA